MIDWLKRVSLEFCCRNEKKSKAQRSDRVRINMASYWVIFTNKLAQVPISALRFDSLSPLVYDTVSFFFFAPSNDYSSMLIQRDVHLCFQRATNGLQCNKNWSKQKRQHFNHTHAQWLTLWLLSGNFSQSFIFIYFLLSHFTFRILTACEWYVHMKFQITNIHIRFRHSNTFHIDYYQW